MSYQIQQGETLRAGIEDAFALGFDTRCKYEREGKTIEFHVHSHGNLCRFGRFANDWDYWCAPRALGDDVVVEQMTPEETGFASSLRNGAMMDPPTMRHAFHGGSVADDILAGPDMSLLFSPPATINPTSKGRPSVIVKSMAADDSNAQNPTRICIEYYETLTILEVPPQEACFRPPFFGAEKPMIPESDFDDSMLSSVQETSGSMSWDDAVETVKSVNVAPITPLRHPGQGLHAFINNQTGRGYDGYVLRQLHGAILKLAQDPGENADKKRALAKGFAQMGIDLYHIHKNGVNPPGQPYSGYGDWTFLGRGCWPAAGGFNGGRLVTIITASVLLNKPAWRTIINESLSTRDGCQSFAETGFIQPNDFRNPEGESRGKGIPTFGHLATQVYNFGSCSGNNRNCAAVGGSDSSSFDNYTGLADGDPLGDSGSPTSYQRCCTLNAWFAAWLTVELNPVIKDAFPDNARHWLEFMDSRKRLGDAGPDLGHWATYDDPNSDSVGYFRSAQYESAGVVTAWEAFRGCLEDGTCTGLNNGGSE